MLNLKKVILGLGLLGVVSSVNAAYIEIPAHYKQVKTGGSVFRPIYSLEFVNLKRVMVYENVFALENGAVGLNTTTAVTCDYTEEGSCYYGTERTVAFTSTILYPNNSKLPGSVGCSTTYSVTGIKGVCPSANLVYPIIKDGKIDSSGNVITGGGYDDTALKSENAILKAKVQALETKVYSCVP